MRTIFRLVLLYLGVICSLTFVRAASAQVAEPSDGPEYSFFDFQHRAQLGARLEHRWVGSPLEAADWAGGVAGSYSLVPRWALTAKALYRLDSETMEYDFGINYQFYGGAK